MTSVDDAATYVFISYSRSDLELARRISRTLTEMGVRTWMDVESIHPGEDFGEAIEHALSRAAALIVLVSARSLNSNWVSYEIGGLTRNIRPTIPVIADNVAAASLPESLRAYQWIDLRENLEEGLFRLAEAASRYVRSNNDLPQPRMLSKGYAFISYAEEDSSFVADLVKFLRERGYGHWEYLDSDRDYQAQMHLELEDVIQKASATLSILTPDWKRSDWTVREYIYSKEIGTPVFLLRLQQMEPTLIIAGTPFIDFSTSRATGFDRLERLLDTRRVLR